MAPTALKFLDSDKLGKEYENDIFVADVVYGHIYHFDLNEDRTELSLEDPFEDKIANDVEEVQPMVFADFEGGITDLQVGPDGYLYVLTNIGEQALIYRIVPR